MKITCVIDSLGSGGAQRQMSILATLLKAHGHAVRIITYHGLDFFKPMLDEAGVPVTCVTYRGQWGRIRAVRSAIRETQPDIVLAYLPIPSFVVEVGSLPWRRFGLVVSERSLDTGRGIPWWNRIARYLLHLAADAVVANSHAQTTVVGKTAPWLKSRLLTILNCVDLETFYPVPDEATVQAGPIRILCLGRFEWVKNYVGLLEALEIVQREHPELDIVLDAFGHNHYTDGKPGPLSGEYLKLIELREGSPARERFGVHEPVANPLPLYHAASTLCLASFYEGCPNVVCEAMACGKPILAARVGDTPVLVEDGVNGFLFDPRSPRDMADAMVRFAALTPAEREAMGRESRARAERLLSKDRFVAQYETLFDRVLAARGEK